MGPVRAAFDHNRQQVALLVDIQGKVHKVFRSERAELQLAVVVGQQPLVFKPPVLVRVDRRSPDFAVMKHNAIENRTRVAIVGLHLPHDLQPRRQLVARGPLLGGRRRMGRVPVGKLSFDTRHGRSLAR